MRKAFSRPRPCLRLLRDGALNSLYPPRSYSEINVFLSWSGSRLLLVEYLCLTFCFCAVQGATSEVDFRAEQSEWRGRLQRVLSASSDTSIANRLGLRVPRAAKRAANLTARESEVHELLAQGLTNDEIAKQLFISLSTTKVHVKHIYEKLGVRSRLEAARALRDDV